MSADAPMGPTGRPSPYLTTLEAQHYLGYQTPGGIRMAVYRGWLRPVGRGPRRTWLFTREAIDAFVALRARATVPDGCRLVRDTATETAPSRSGFALGTTPSRG